MSSSIPMHLSDDQRKRVAYLIQSHKYVETCAAGGNKELPAIFQDGVLSGIVVTVSVDALKDRIASELWGILKDAFIIHDDQMWRVRADTITLERLEESFTLVDLDA